MFRFAKTVSRESGKPALFIVIDMVFTILKYGIGYQEYASYGFVDKNAAKRKTFMSIYHNHKVDRELNDQSLVATLDNKDQFIKIYKDFLNRNAAVAGELTLDEFRAFLEKHPVVFIKKAYSYGGLDVKKVVSGEIEDVPKLYDSLTKNPDEKYVIEEGIAQHPKINELYPGSVNTMRVVTMVQGGEAKWLYTIFRVGKGGKSVDNASSGGVYCRIYEDGIIHYNAFCEKEAKYYEVHPDTKTPFVGFEIPYYKEALDFCLRAAMVEPRLGYVGWDCAIAENGPCLVEANILPGYDMPQNKTWCKNGEGMLPLFEEKLGHKIQ